MVEADGVSPHDVLIGKPQERQAHDGNVLLRKMVRDRTEQAIRDSSTSESDGEDALFKAVVGQIHSRGGRFLRWNAAGKEWEEVSFRVAIDKVRGEFINHKSETSSVERLKPQEGNASSPSENKTIEEAPLTNEGGPQKQEDTLAAAATRIHRCSKSQPEMVVPPVESNSRKPTTPNATSLFSLGILRQDPSSIEPTGADYLCGKKTFCVTHPGTKFVKEECIAWRIEEYEAAEKGRKEVINIEIVLQVYARGGRFLSQSHGAWSVYSFTASRRKVGTLFRTKLAHLKKSSTRPSNPKAPEKLGVNDVPLNGAWYQEHPGTLYLKRLASENAGHYVCSSSKQYRENIVARIQRSITDNGGSFKSKKTGRWETVQNHVARMKVSEEMTKACHKLKAMYGDLRARADSFSTTHDSADATLNTIDLSARDICERQPVDSLLDETESFITEIQFQDIDSAKMTNRQPSRCSSVSTSSTPARKMTRPTSNHRPSGKTSSSSSIVAKRGSCGEDSFSVSIMASSYMSWTSLSSLLRNSTRHSRSGMLSVATEESSLSLGGSDPELECEERSTPDFPETPTQVICKQKYLEENVSLSEPMNVCTATSLLDEMKAGIDDAALLKRSFGELSHLIWNDSKIQPETAAASVQIVVEAINKHATDPQLSGYGCSALAWLTKALDSDRSIVLQDVNAIEVVLSCMSSHLNIDLVQESGVKALVEVALIDFNNIQDIEKAGGLRSVVIAMDKNRYHEQIQEYGCMMLAILAKVDPPIRTAIAEAGGVEAVARALVTHPLSGCVQRNGCFAFRWLGCHSHTHQCQIHALGGFELVHAASRGFPNDAALQSHVKEFLSWAPTFSSTVSACPPESENDVFFGHDPGVVHSVGNRKLREMVADGLKTYRAYGNNQKVAGKGSVITNIMDTISGSRWSFS